MVVVLIMGILMAIAIPTFLSTQGSANDASAKSNATNAFTSEKAYYEDNQVFLDGTTAAAALSLDSQLPWAAAAATFAASKTVEVFAGVYASSVLGSETPGGTGSGLLVEAASKSGNCFYIADNELVSPPVIAYAEGATACEPIASVTIGAAQAGNAGAHITAAGAVATGDWYASW
jgi:type IV pilus assembly protein PilA